MNYHFNYEKRQGCTPLSLAISNDYLYMVIKLLELKADPNIADNNGNIFSRINIYKIGFFFFFFFNILLNLGDTPLIKAIWSTMNTDVENEQIFQIVKTLIEYGADIDARNDTGRTALFTAIYQNNTQIALHLIERGAKCELEDKLMSNFTLLHYACFQGIQILKHNAN